MVFNDFARQVKSKTGTFSLAGIFIANSVEFFEYLLFFSTGNSGSFIFDGNTDEFLIVSKR